MAPSRTVRRCSSHNHSRQPCFRRRMLLRAIVAPRAIGRRQACRAIGRRHGCRAIGRRHGCRGSTCRPKASTCRVIQFRYLRRHRLASWWRWRCCRCSCRCRWRSSTRCMSRSSARRSCSRRRVSKRATGAWPATGGAWSHPGRRPMLSNTCRTPRLCTPRNITPRPTWRTLGCRTPNCHQRPRTPCKA